MTFPAKAFVLDCWSNCREPCRSTNGLAGSGSPDFPVHPSTSSGRTEKSLSAETEN